MNKGFFSGALVYFGSSVLSATIPFFLLPILTRYLSPSQYGEVAMFQLLIGLLGAFVGFNVNGAIVREYYSERNSEEYKNYIGACIILFFISTLIVCVFTYTFSEQLTSFFDLSVDNLKLAVLVSSAMFLMKIRLSQYQIKKKVINYALVQVPNSAINVLLSLIFVMYFDFGSDGRIDGISYAALVTGVFCLLSFKLEKTFKFDCLRREYFTESIKYGLSITPHVIGIFLLASIDRVIIKEHLGLESAGIYMAALQVSMIMSLTFEALNKAYVPWLFDKLKANKASDKSKIVKYTYLYIAFLIVIGVVVYYTVPFISILILGDEYKSASNIVGILCLAQICNGIYLMFTNYLLYNKKVGMLSFVTISSGAIHVLCSIYLIQTHDLKGVAMSFLIATVYRAMMTYYHSVRHTDMPWFKIREV
ncbi:oligosaccharide flippase family protein [Photobacterium makurazakiensis]|uniref:lipopolysaccharide biosynthesis protein n=1 Tax=Photobacterium makurazakiensis TaxID=2910234 RepID=UPI003D0E2ACD